VQGGEGGNYRDGVKLTDLIPTLNTEKIQGKRGNLKECMESKDFDTKKRVTKRKV